MLTKIIRLIGIFFFTLVLWLIVKEVDKVGGHHLWEVLSTTPFYVVLLCLFFTALDFCFLTGYDLVSLKYMQQKIPLNVVTKAGTIGFAISNTTGHAYLSGGSVRYLFYSPKWLSKGQVLKLIALNTITYLLGSGSIFCLAIAILPFEKTSLSFKYSEMIYLGGSLVLATILIYILKFVLPQKKITLSKMTFVVPNLKTTLQQILVGLADNLSAVMAFYVLLRFYLDVPFLEVLSFYVIAQMIGQMTQIPGALGVFEGSFLYLFGGSFSQHGEILSALILFRVLYYFVPFFVSGIYLIYRTLKLKLHQSA